jgi:cell wall-associated NlpC family hydrolase
VECISGNAAKHRKTHSVKRITRIVAAGALSMGALAITAAPASANTLDIPGVGAIDVPPEIAQAAEPIVATQPPIVLPPEVAQAVEPFLAAVAPALAPVNALGERVFQAAQSKLGAPYVWGATGPNAFDCSGLVLWAYREAGVEVPRTSYQQVSAGYGVSVADIPGGDILTFNGGGHSGIYAGNGNVIHAPQAGQPVQISPVSSMGLENARRL